MYVHCHHCQATFLIQEEKQSKTPGHLPYGAGAPICAVCIARHTPYPVNHSSYPLSLLRMNFALLLFVRDQGLKLDLRGTLASIKESKIVTALHK